MGDALHTDGGVTSAKDARMADSGLIAAQGPSPLDVRTGVMHGPGTTAVLNSTSNTAPMLVAVTPHQWVTTRGASNGPYRGALESAVFVTIAAAPASGSRIDVVYVKQRDSTAGVPTPDGVTGELVDVVTGVSTTGTPSKPALPVGAEELGTVTVAAGATATNGAGVTIANTARLTVARGARIPVRSQTERDALTAFTGLEVYRLDNGQVQLCTSTTGPTWATVYDPLNSIPAALPLAGNGTTTGFANYDAATYASVSYYKDASGQVHVEGLGKNLAVIAAGSQTTPVGTLPSGFRPTSKRPSFQMGVATLNQVFLEITQAGVINILNASASTGIGGVWPFSLTFNPRL